LPGTGSILVVVGIFLLVDSLVVWGIRQWVKITFAELAKAYPPVAVGAGAVTKRYQSIAVDSLNFGGCFVVSADEFGVHFAPMWLARVFGARAFSVPFEAMELKPKGLIKWGSTRKVKVGRYEITGPGWALELVGE
jgi:hypothetical protein